MISVVASFDDEPAANTFLGELAREGVSPDRTSVDTNDGVTIRVEVDEEDYEAMMSQMRRAGANSVAVERDVRRPDTAGRPTLDDPHPPPPVGPS